MFKIKKRAIPVIFITALMLSGVDIDAMEKKEVTQPQCTDCKNTALIQKCSDKNCSCHYCAHCLWKRAEKSSREKSVIPKVLCSCGTNLFQQLNPIQKNALLKIHCPNNTKLVPDENIQKRVCMLCKKEQSSEGMWQHDCGKSNHCVCEECLKKNNFIPPNIACTVFDIIEQTTTNLNTQGWNKAVQMDENTQKAEKNQCTLNEQFTQKLYKQNAFNTGVLQSKKLLAENEKIDMGALKEQKYADSFGSLDFQKLLDDGVFNPAWLKKHELLDPTEKTVIPGFRFMNAQTFKYFQNATTEGTWGSLASFSLGFGWFLWSALSSNSAHTMKQDIRSRLLSPWSAILFLLLGCGANMKNNALQLGAHVLAGGSRVQNYVLGHIHGTTLTYVSINKFFRACFAFLSEQNINTSMPFSEFCGAKNARILTQCQNTFGYGSILGASAGLLLRGWVLK